MPDGSAPLDLRSDPFAADLLGPEWLRMGSLTADGDLVSLQAAVRFAELAVEAAEKEALAEALQAGDQQTRESADTLDQVAADWAAKTQADEQIIHAFLGIADPVGREAATTFREADVDARLDAFLDNLPDTLLENGELAALSAFDAALARGSDAEEALSAAIQAAEQVESSVLAGAALADLPPGIGLRSDRLTRPDEERDTETQVSDQTGTETRDLPQTLFVSSIPAGLLSAFALGQTGSSDSAFGFGFQFSPRPVEIFVPAENRRPDERSEAVVLPTEVNPYTNIIGTPVTDLLVGSQNKDAIGGRESSDYIYADRPTNYDSASHDASNPLTNPTFSAFGSDDIVSGGGGDDFLWGGAGDDLLHGDVPDTSSTLFSEFAFSLGSTPGGDDTLYGGAGNDNLWGGAGNDVVSGEDGNDWLSGGAGTDQLYGNAGTDNIFGYAGDDILQGGEDDDTLSGGDGADRFQFAGGSGATVSEHVQSLGTDTITDYSAAEGDSFSLSDADFAFGNSDTLTDGVNYFEIAEGILSSGPIDVSGGVSGSAILVMGADSGTDGASVYYTEDAAAASNLNSYQIADLISVNASDFEAADFLLTS